MLQSMVIAAHDAQRQLRRRHGVGAGSEEQGQKRDEILPSIVNGCSAQEQDFRCAHVRLQREIAIGTRIPYMMRFVDDDEIPCRTMIGSPSTLICVGAAQRFEGDDARLGASGSERSAPHGSQPGGSHNQTARESSADGQRDVSLSHADIVAEQGTIELIDRCRESRYR